LLQLLKFESVSFCEEAAARLSVKSLSAAGWNEFPFFGLGFERISRFSEWQQRLEWCGFSAGEWETNPLLLLL
jgi:hypothetical protein